MQKKTAGETKSKTSQQEVNKAQCCMPSTTREAAMDMRKANSAIPAVPVGNIVNSLCTT